MNRQIAWFEEFGKEDVETFGAKNANLGEMLRRGFPIPPGFAISIDMYRRFVSETGAAEEMSCYVNSLSGLKSKGITAFEKISKTMQDIIHSKEMPLALKKEISSHYEELCHRIGIPDVAVSVRSAGTKSRPGIFETYLNIRGVEEVLDKLKRVWASAYTTRAIAFRITKDLPVIGDELGVAILKMVNARSAGVGFTVHPGTGDDTRILLEGNWGVGESVVQGIVIPDMFVINKETLTLEEKKINPKLKQVIIKQMGTEEQEVPEDKRLQPCLSDEEVLKIAELARALERSYGIPLDLEWAVDGTLPFPQNIFLVQARPITKVAEKKDAIDKILDMMLSQ